MKKETVLAQVRKTQELIVAELSEKIATVHSMVDMDEDNTLDPEDFSHQYEAGEMEHLIRVQLNKARRQLDMINTLDFSAKTHVAPGAYIETDHFNCLVAFATTPFMVDGKTVVGISIDSPIYASMLGKKENDSFAFGGRTYQILQII
jgi:transcription elongation factor GreA